MNGANFLIDTNIIVYLSQKKVAVSDFAKNGDSLYVSTVTYMEALGFPFQSKEEEAAVTTLCNTFERLFLTEDIEKQTILIRKNLKIKLPDAIIAATAIAHNLTLVTRNSSDFKNIFGLKIFTPCN